MMKGFPRSAFFTTVARTQYWFPAPPTIFAVNSVFIEDQRMLRMDKMLKLLPLLMTYTDTVKQTEREREREVHIRYLIDLSQVWEHLFCFALSCFCKWQQMQT